MKLRERVRYGTACLSRWTVIGVIASIGVAGINATKLASLWNRPSIVRTWTDEIVDGGDHLRSIARVEGDWVPVKQGLGLGAGGAGSLLLRVEKQPAESCVLILSFGGAKNSVEVSPNGVDFEAVLRNVDATERPVDLRTAGEGQRELFVRLMASSSPGEPVRVVLDRLQLLTLDRSSPVPDLPTMALSVLLVLGAAALGRILLGPRGELIAAGVSFLVVLALPAVAPQTWGPVSAYHRFRWSVPLLADLIVVGTMGIVAVFTRTEECLRRAEQLAAGWIVAFGLLMRWSLLAEAPDVTLAPDAETVQLIASRMAHPFDTDFREPLWPWLVRAYSWFFGPTVSSVRLFSMSGAVGLLLLAYGFARRYTGDRVLALLVMGVLAVHGLLIQSAARGLRTELQAVVLLSFCWFCFIPEISPRRRAIGWAITAPLAALASLSMLAPMAVLGVWASWKQKVDPRLLAIPITTIVLLVTPHLAYNQHKFGSPSYFNSVLTGVWYRNYEFVEVKATGCHGCPTLEEFQRNGFSGARTTVTHYIFGMHPLREVVTRTARGYLELFILPGSDDLSSVVGTAVRPVHYLYLLGVVLLIRSRWREIIFVPFLTINAIAFLVPLQIDPRIYAHVAPYAAIATALPVAYAVNRLAVFAGKYLDRQTPPHSVPA